MKIFLFFAGVILVFYLIFKSGDWSESDNKAKSSIGCTVMALLIGFGILITILGTFKSLTSCEGASHDYYDAPRK